jgi:hypothetical protein
MVVVINGYPVTGFMPGDYLTIESTGPDAKSTQGSHGTVCVHQLNNNISNIKIGVLHGERSHSVLSSMAKVAKITSVMAHAFVVKDLLGTLLVTGKIWFTTPAPIKFGEEAGNHEWSFEGVVDIFDAGGIPV